jgi:hypothetical protein
MAAAIVEDLGPKDRQKLKGLDVDAARNSAAAGTYGYQ